jgi:hypothetical protein
VLPPLGGLDGWTDVGCTGTRGGCTGCGVNTGLLLMIGPVLAGGVEGSDWIGGAVVVTGGSVVTGAGTKTGTGTVEDSAGGGSIGRTVGVGDGLEGRLAAVGGEGDSVTLTGFTGTSWWCCTAMATAGTAISPATSAAPFTTRRVSFRRLPSPSGSAGGAAPIALAIALGAAPTAD